MLRCCSPFSSTLASMKLRKSPEFLAIKQGSQAFTRDRLISIPVYNATRSATTGAVQSITSPTQYAHSALNSSVNGCMLWQTKQPEEAPRSKLRSRRLRISRWRKAAALPWYFTAASQLRVENSHPGEEQNEELDQCAEFKSNRESNVNVQKLRFWQAWLLRH